MKLKVIKKIGHLNIGDTFDEVDYTSFYNIDNVTVTFKEAINYGWLEEVKEESLVSKITEIIEYTSPNDLAQLAKDHILEVFKKNNCVEEDATDDCWNCIQCNLKAIKEC